VETAGNYSGALLDNILTIIRKVDRMIYARKVGCSRVCFRSWYSKERTFRDRFSFSAFSGRSSP
jgi:hypothetical protein